MGFDSDDALLTAITQVWWIVALLLSSSLGPPVLETTETYMQMRGIRRVARALYGPEGLDRDGLGRVLELQVFDEQLEPLAHTAGMGIVDYTVPEDALTGIKPGGKLIFETIGAELLELAERDG